MKRIILAFTLVTAFMLSSCSGDDDVVVNVVDNLTLNLEGLEELGDDYVYEGWLLVDGAPVSTGTFTSVTFPQNFEVPITVLNSATQFVLTIEPAGETGTAALTPADSKLLSATFSGNSATVETGTLVSSDSESTDFTLASGVMFLRTPTDETGTNNGNDQYGLWFGTPGMPPTSGFMNLPELAEGWTYEGWVVVDGVGPISTGTFTDTEMRDSGNPFSGTQNNAGPPIPGEDFLLNAPDGFTFPLDVRGRTAVITIEPVPDNSAAPFALKPYIGTVGNEFAPATHDLDYNTGGDGFPSGTVTR